MQMKSSSVKFLNESFAFSLAKLLFKSFLIILLVLPIYPQQSPLKFKKLTSNEGLSQNFVSAIYQDKNGFMWFGTKDGLNRYDGYEFKVYRHNPFDTTSLSGNYISTLFEDSKGRLWVASNTLDLFIPEKDAFKRIVLKIPANKTDSTININKITSIAEDKNGLLWLGTNDGLISYNTQTESSRMFYQTQDKSSPLSDNLILSLSSDDSLIIIGTQNGMKLLNLDSVKENKIEYVKIFHEDANELLTSRRTILSQFRASSNLIYSGTPAGLVKIDLGTRKSEFIPYRGHTFFPFWHNRILSIVQDKNGNLWFACSGGLVIYNPISGNFRYYFHDPKDDQSLSLNNITSLFTDRGGKIWIGTAGKGINLFDQNKKEFSLYDGLVDKEPFKSSFSVSAILSENEDYLWIASQQNLFRLDRVTGEYKYINLLYGPEGEITSLVKDNKQNIWISSSGGLHKISDNGNRTTYYGHNPSNPNSLKDLFVRLLFIDSNGNLFALNSRYFSRFNEGSNTFTHYELNFVNKNDFAPIIRFIYESEDGSLWFGWAEGLVKYNLETKEKIIFRHEPGNNKSISNNEVLTICEDPTQPKKYLWVGTQGGGLSRLNLDDGTFSNFSVTDGLPNNVIYGILSSGDELWLSTNNGLCRVTADKYGTPTFRNYDVTDGLQGNEFNTGAYSKSNSSELFFGGLNGVNAFFPSSIRDNIYVPPVVFTELKFLKGAFDGKDGLQPGINTAINISEVTIPHSQNSFTIQFAALDYTATEKNRYMYKLVPIHDDWINLGTQRNVTFTELGAGDYKLIVKGSNNDGIWNEEGASLKIIITPPFWQTFWAYGIYAVILIIVLYIVRRYELSRLRLKNRLKIESFETRKLKEIDEMKSGFFANISHEFRTPLTLILGPAEQLEQNETDDNKKEKLYTIKSSANRLLRLINQILDLSKLEKGKTRLRCQQGDLVIFLKGIINSFSSIAERKNICLQFVSEASNIQTYFDRDLFEKIFYNLLSNAFKFTPNGGSIEVKINQPGSESINSPANKYCKISIKDSGVGIGENDLPKVFNKFYTVENINGFTEQGSGIGLALVKELVELHKGSITVESRIDEGSTFTVTIPIGKDYLREDEIIMIKPEESDYPGLGMKELLGEDILLDENNDEIGEEDDPLIALIVEDNSELRKYIASILQSDYKIMEASTGKEGCIKAAESIPDIIVSDIMMPEMDGYTLCKKLKTDERTSHIPIILLTARAGEEDKLSGLETGADDYLTKPFSSKELSLRVKNLIEIRQTLRKKFSSSLVIKPKEIATGSVDKTFLEKAMKTVEKNISNDKFSVEDFSREMNLSHSQLHRKLKALVNQSAIQFIRSIRMQRALELLQSNSGNIAEIAWRVGFGDPSYFTKTFSKHFGYLPSDINK
jgi:signal transduction histidine kinase/ligand-binding sensor domain-containing protein/DNA-binding response OmpR family regulator